MAINTKLCFLFFLLFFFILSTHLSRAEGEVDKEDNQDDQEAKLDQCLKQCHYESERGGSQHVCMKRCEKRYGQRSWLHSHRRPSRGYEEEEEQQQKDIPYYFDERSFTTKFRTEEGRVSLLENFAHRSDLLRGLENYRLQILEANPKTFVLPVHLDAEAALFVLDGIGEITMVRQHNKESYNLERGDVIRIPSGTTFYLVNKDNSARLRIAKFLYTHATPGQFKEFFPAGGRDPQTYLRVFSRDVIQAALNTRTEKLHRVLTQQREGVIIRATEDQIKELTRRSSDSRPWAIGRGIGYETRAPYNMFNRKPLHSNNHGQVYKVRPEDYRELQNLDLLVFAANISKGAMMGPYFNTRSTVVVMVDRGNLVAEMACPHLWRDRERRGRYQEEEELQYEKVRVRLSPGTVLVVPAGHPVVFVAIGNEDVEVFGFGINARDNHENFLAGREWNVLRQLGSQALELGFQAPRKEVELLVNSQDESVFFPGPRQQPRELEREREQEQEQEPSIDSTKQQALNTVLDVVGV